MRAEFYLSPLHETPMAFMDFDKPVKVMELLKLEEFKVPPWFFEAGEVKVNGQLIARDRWELVTIKPNPANVVELCIVNERQYLAPALAVVGAVGAIAIGTLGLPFLGIAAGSLWANVLAAGVGIATQLAVRALTAPPQLAPPGEGANTQNMVGIQSNTPILNDTLPYVVGKMGASAPFLMPPYTVWTTTGTKVVAVIGMEGRCLIENVLINGQTTDHFADINIETREGASDDTARTIGTETVIEQQLNMILSQFDTKQITYPNDPLQHQPLNTNDLPQWHGLKTSGDADDFTIRFLSPSGFSDSNAPTNNVSVPIRIQIRKRGTSTWRKLPEIHIQDIRHGTGAFRAEVKCVFKTMAQAGVGGAMIGKNPNWNIWALYNRAGRGTAYEYDADTYFNQTVDADFYHEQNNSGITPVATGATTSGVTFSASTESVGFEAWRAFDAVSGSGTPWNGSPTDPDPWLKVDLGSAQTIKSYTLISSSVTEADLAPSWTFEGSNNNVDWTILDTVNHSGAKTFFTHCQVQTPGSYRYYRWHFPSTGIPASGWKVNVGRLYTANAVCSSFDSDNGLTSNRTGVPFVYSGLLTEARCCNAAMTENGVTFYLDPATWDTGEYEAQIMRGMPFDSSDLTPFTYATGNSADTAGFFDYTTDSDGNVCAAYGKYYRSDLNVELIQTHQAIAPFDPTGIAFIALEITDTQVDSVYAEWTRYAAEWDPVAAQWKEVKVPTKNPASQYREILLGSGNNRPVQGDIIDEAELGAWWETCDAEAYECNALFTGTRILEGLQVIASAGFAAPRTANFFGVVEDKDVTSQIPNYAITPLNSKNRGLKPEPAELPHAMRVSYADETDRYAQTEINVFRDGYDATNATLYEAVSYMGHTTAANATRRASFDFKQAQYRPRKFNYEVGREGYLYKRGMLIGLNNDSLADYQMAGYINTVTYDSPTLPRNITSITLDNVMPWSKSAAFEDISDLGSVADVTAPGTRMAVSIRLPNQTLILREVSDNIDSNVCTFLTPIPDDGTIVPDMMVIAGTLADTYKRLIVFNRTPTAQGTWLLELIDEAPQLWS